jgi:hypothetical protein
MSLEETPILSTTDRGRKMTQLLPAQPVGEVDAGIVLLVTAGVSAWAIASSVPYAALLGLAPTPAADVVLGSPWAAAVAVVIAFLALVLTGSVHQRPAPFTTESSPTSTSATPGSGTCRCPP